MPRRPRTSPRRRSSPRSTASTASTAGGRSRPGCTGSWSTARSTGGVARRCARSAGDPEERAAPSHADEPSGGELMPALAQLPPEQRAVVVLRYLLEYTPGEIGAHARAAARDGQLAPAPRPRPPARPDRGGGMNEDRLRALLREEPLPGAAEAERRGLALVERAYAERRPRRPAGRCRGSPSRSPPPPCSRRCSSRRPGPRCATGSATSSPPGSATPSRR